MQEGKRLVWCGCMALDGSSLVEAEKGQGWVNVMMLMEERVNFIIHYTKTGGIVVKCTSMYYIRPQTSLWAIR